MAADPHSSQSHSHEEEHDEHHEEHGEHAEPWLVSYADLMTLLVGFFVIMYAFASANAPDESVELIQMRKELAQYFGMQDPRQEEGKFLAEKPMTTEDAIREIIQRLKEMNIVQADQIVQKKDGFDLNFDSAILFDSGSAVLNPNVEEKLRALSKELLWVKDSIPRIVVEGHTDDVPVRKSKYFPSNWELSAARAGAVVRILQDSGYPISNLAAVGLAESQPVVRNRDDQGKPLPENLAKNRRVTLRVLMTSEKPGDPQSKELQTPSPTQEETHRGTTGGNT